MPTTMNTTNKRKIPPELSKRIENYQIPNVDPTAIGIIKLLPVVLEVEVSIEVFMNGWSSHHTGKEENNGLIELL